MEHNEPTEQTAHYQLDYTLTPADVAPILEAKPQSIREQIADDIQDGTNEQNFNAFKIGNRILIPARWFWEKLTKPVGKSFEVDARFADWMIAHGFAKEVQNDQD